MVHVLEGEDEVTISGNPVQLKAGQMVIMPAGQPHALGALPCKGAKVLRYPAGVAQRAAAQGGHHLIARIEQRFQVRQLALQGRVGPARSQLLGHAHDFRLQGRQTGGLLGLLRSDALRVVGGQRPRAQ